MFALSLPLLDPLSLSFCWQLLKILIALFFFLFSFFFFFFSLAGNFATDVDADADAATAVVELSSLCWLPCAFCSLLRFAFCCCCSSSNDQLDQRQELSSAQLSSAALEQVTEYNDN